MIWYISSSKKRGDYIKKIINWCLLVDNKTIINEKNKECNYIIDKLLEYNEKDFKNIVDLENKLYIRDGIDYKIVIDFNKMQQIITLKDKNLDFFMDIEGSINNSNNIINIKYNNSDGNKEIIIQIL